MTDEMAAMRDFVLGVVLGAFGLFCLWIVVGVLMI